MISDLNVKRFACGRLQRHWNLNWTTVTIINMNPNIFHWRIIKTVSTELHATDIYVGHLSRSPRKQHEMRYCGYRIGFNCNRNHTFYVLLTVHLGILCNENQPDALFNLNVFRQLTSTCFGHVHCPSSGGVHSICTASGTCYTFRLTGSWPGQDGRVPSWPGPLPVTLNV
jgi:hypothetical protein